MNWVNIEFETHSIWLNMRNIVYVEFGRDKLFIRNNDSYDIHLNRKSCKNYDQVETTLLKEIVYN